jgi:hypothetical protein
MYRLRGDAEAEGNSILVDAGAGEGAAAEYWASEANLPNIRYDAQKGRFEIGADTWARTTSEEAFLGAQEEVWNTLRQQGFAVAPAVGKESAP